MADKNQVTPFVWGDISLTQTVMIDGIPHATREAIGEWLGYDDPIRAISKLLERTSYIEEHSTVVKLTTVDGKNRDVFVYHPIGFLLIVMESGQQRAIEMKQAVAEFVWHFAGPRKMSVKEHIELQKLARSLYNDIGRTKDKFAVTGLIAMLRDVCLTLGAPVPNLAFLGKELDQLALPGV